MIVNINFSGQYYQNQKLQKMKEYDMPAFGLAHFFIILIALPSTIAAVCTRERCCVPSTCTTLYCIQSNSQAWNSTQSYSNYQYTKLVMVNNQCKPCSHSCKKCSSQFTCTQCYDGFYMEGSTCKNCQYKCLKCQVINSLSKCSLCDTGSYLDTNTLNCKVCPDGAKSCTSPSSIIDCNTGYLKSSNSLFCTSCTSNCNSCPSSTSICTSCATGYYLASNICKICNITNCIACASQTLCTTCLQGYFRINSSTCSSCPVNCKTCSSSIICTVCKTGYYIQAGGCSSVLSLIDSCSVYSNSTLSGKNKCSTCSSGYYLSQNSLSCFPCSILCNVCYGGHFGRCSSCKSNAKLFNQMCLPLSYIDQRRMQAYYSAPSDGWTGGPLSSGEITCDGLLYKGANIKLQLNNLGAYKILITYKIFSDVSSQQYTISLNSTTGSSSLSNSNSSFNSLSHSSSSLSYSICSTLGDTKQYSSHINSVSFSQIKLQNTLSFTSVVSSLNIYISQILVTIYKCESLCLQCSESLCFTCMNKNLYKQDVYCVYACGKGYYTYQDGKSCLKQCPIGTYALLTNISCMTCEKPCLTCLNSKYCLSCIEGYFLNTLTYTCQKQCPYRYYGSIKTQKCQRCVGRCNQCISDQQCLSCDLGFLENKTCVDNCRIGFYEDIDTLKCQNCSILCLSCKYKPDFCLTCEANKLLHNNTCVQKCPSGFFSKSNASYCDSCIYPCQSCQNQSNLCITCVDGFLLNNTCLSSCPISYYQDTGKLVCRPCNYFCTKCTQQEDYCIQCKNNYKLLDNRCLLDCPPGYYDEVLPNTTFKICSKCVGACYTCSNQSFCLSCNSNFLTSNSSGQCVRSSQCQINQYANVANLKCESCSSACFTCLFSPTICTSCQVGSILYNNSCVSSCPSQYFYSSQLNLTSQSFSTCTVCEQPCLTCIDQNKCLSCINGYKYSSVNNICSSTCSIGSFFNKTINDCQSCSTNCLNCLNSNFCFICKSNNFLLILTSSENKCVSQCPTQYYADSLSCMNCLYPCKDCKSSIDCLSCQNGVLYQNRCLSGCPQSTFMNVPNNTCENCIGYCLTCKNSATQCTSCKNNYYLLQSTFKCAQSCPNGTYIMQLSKSCISCPDTCSNCLNNSYCISCIAGKTFLQISTHMCLQYCPASFFGSNQTNKCQKCDSKCLTCSNFSQCLTCGENFVLVRLQNASFDCKNICPPQYYNDSNICYKCLFPCKNCLSASQCLTCALGTYYHSQSYSCLLSCPLGTYYENSKTFSCLSCLDPCETCKNSTTCISCISGFLLFQGLCVANCPQKYYADASGICNRCYGLCETCVGKYECLTCQTGFAYSGYCYSACPPGTFASEKTKKCQPCTSPCLECTSTSYYCKKCLNNLLAYRGICSQKCPDGTFINGQVCETCQFPCIKCSNQFTCEKCIGGYLLYMKTSCIANVQKCPNDLYKMNSNQCVPSTWCPDNYYKQQALKTCSNQCSRQKYVNDVRKSCLDNCGEGQYLGENMVCKNWILEPPKSILGMETISFVQSSEIHIIVKFNESVTWLEKSNALYTLKNLQLNRRLLSVSQSSINYTQASTQELILEVKEIGYNIQINLEAYKVKSSVTNYNLQTSLIKVEIPQFTAYTYDHIYIGSIMKQFSEGMSWFIILFSMFFLFMNRLSDVYILWDTSQLLYLLIFLDMQYPPNLNQFLSGLSNINFLFIPSLFSSIAPKQRLKSSQSFYAYSFDNSFARTAGSPLLLVIIVVCIYLLLKLVENLAKWSERFKEKLDQYPNLKSRIYKGILRFRWHHTSDVFFLTYNVIVLFSVAEIYFIKENPNNIGSNVICILSLVLYLLFPAFVSYKLYRHFGNISKGKMVANLQCFYRGIQKTNKFGISLILIRYFRKLTYGMLIGIFSKEPMFILPILMFTSVLLGLFTFINKPFKKRLSNIISVGTEVGLVIVYLMMALIKFGKDQFSPELKMVLGWVCCGVLLIILFALIFQIFCKTMFYLQSETSTAEGEKKQIVEGKVKSLGEITKKYGEQYIRKKAGQFFDKMLPKLKQHFNLDDSQQELNDQYQEGDSENSQNNLEREKNWGFESSNSSEKRSEQFRHYGGESQENEQKKEQKPPTYLIRCVKQIQ